MTTDTTTHRPNPYSSRGRLLRLGYAALGSAIAWALHLNIMYFLVQPVCRLGGDWTFHVTSALLLAVSLGAGFTAWQALRNDDRDVDDELESRSAAVPFVGAFGVAAAAIFSLAIVTQWVPTLVLGSCS